MTDKPLVSVIINCYNGEKYLREAIDSVIAQTYDNWELVFWDNQSTDSTREIVESYGDPRIHYFYAPEHTPLGEARNLAVEKANGEYINFLDADDVWSFNKLEKQVGLIGNQNIAFSFTDFDVLLESEDAYNSKTYSLFKRLQKRKIGENIYFELLKGNFIVFSSVLFKKEDYTRHGGVNGSFKQNEDYDILLKCSCNSDVAYVKEKLIKYRIHGDNGSNSNGDTGSLGYYENRTIFNSLPESKELRYAYEENEIRIAISKMRNGDIIDNLLTIIRPKSWFYLGKMALLRFCGK